MTEAILPLAADGIFAGGRGCESPQRPDRRTRIDHHHPWHAVSGNLDMARSVETIIRDEGAVPATIAVIDGTLHIGLDDASWKSWHRRRAR